MGGKSKAEFYRSYDDKFVIKQLTSKWTLDEKEQLLKFTPSYLEHMNESDKNPSILAKIFGFYTIKEKNLVTGHSVSTDFLVMEHLFANMSILKVLFRLTPFII